MAIIKNKRYESPFVQIDRRTIQDHSLSFKARGLLAYILSFPPDWEISVKQFATHAEQDGKSSIYSGFQELRRAGYVTYAPIRDPEKKHIQEWCYFAYERPEQNPNPETPRPTRSENQPENPQTENRDVVENRANKGKSYKAENPRLGNLNVGNLKAANLNVGNRDAYNNKFLTDEFSEEIKLGIPPQKNSVENAEEQNQEPPFVPSPPAEPQAPQPLAPTVAEVVSPELAPVLAGLDRAQAMFAQKARNRDLSTEKAQAAYLSILSTFAPALRQALPLRYQTLDLSTPADSPARSSGGGYGRRGKVVELSALMKGGHV